MCFMVGMGLGDTQFVGFLGFMGKCVASGNALPVECQLFDDWVPTLRVGWRKEYDCPCLAVSEATLRLLHVTSLSWMENGFDREGHSLGDTCSSFMHFMVTNAVRLLIVLLVFAFFAT